MNIHTYSLALISTSGSQKSPTAISHEIGVSQSSIMKHIKGVALDYCMLQKLIQKLKLPSI